MYSNETFGYESVWIQAFFVEYQPLDDLPLNGSYMAITWVNEGEFRIKGQIIFATVLCSVK